MYLYKAAMICCMKSLGPNHIRTAHIHMNFGLFYLKWAQREHKDQKTSALQHFEQAFMIYSSYQDKLGDSSQFIEGNLSASNQCSLSVIADSAIQVAAIMEE